MASGMTVRLPVSVPFGTDEEFDLRVRLERELVDVLEASGAGRGAGGEIDTSHMNLHIEEIRDPAAALSAAKEVLARNALLGRAVVVVETRNPFDPDELDCRVVWPVASAGAARVA